MTETTAVVVHWRERSETLGCVESVRGAGIRRVIVVDNAGDAGLGAALRPIASDARVLSPGENLGYAGGGNLGLQAALADGAEVVLLLNNDARMDPEADAAARTRLASDARIAVVGGRIVTREDADRLWLAWGDVTFGPSFVRLHGADAPNGPPFDQVRDVDWVAGCALWFPRASLEALGGFDERLFAYHEEVEWCLRARRAGRRVVYEPAAIVTHTGRGSGGNAASIRIRKYFAARNAMLVSARHGRLHERVRHAAVVGGQLVAELAWHGMRGTLDGTWWKVRGVRDAILGRRPPFEELGLK